LNNVVETSRQEGIEEGIVIGRDEGIVIGRDEGIVIGRDEGIIIGRDEGIVIGKDEGIVIGRDEGIVIGRDEGIIEGKKSLLLKQLSRKLGDIPDPIQQQINQLSGESLEILSEMLFELENLDDLRQWLDNL
jgi:flagellar biosynthesis/type III secretory pathway protein FliH